MANQSKKIASVPLIKDLSPVLQDAVVQILDSISEELMLNKGETLYHECEEGDNTGVLLISGSVNISHGNTDPKIVKAPELFGEMRQMNHKGQRVATICANEGSTILRFSWHNFIGVLMKISSITKEQRVELRRALNQIGNTRLQELFDSKS